MSKRKKFYRQKGISLIESAMVVVIVGLIAGAFITYYNFQHALLLRAIITEATNYKAGIKEFRDKYYALPGDMTLAHSYWEDQCGGSGLARDGGCNGNGDGRIVWDEVEGAKAWQLLSIAGMVTQSYTGTCSNINRCTGEIGNNIPGSEHPGVGYYIDSSDVTNGHNVIGISAAGTIGTAEGAFLTAIDSLSIDYKMDDGLPNQGFVHAFPQEPPCIDTAESPVKYAYGKSKKACQLMFRF